jgi:hypothetical protein
MSSTFAASTLDFHRTGIAHFGIELVNRDLLRFSSRMERDNLALGTNIRILLRIVVKELGGIILSTLAEIGCIYYKLFRFPH